MLSLQTRKPSGLVGSHGNQGDQGDQGYFSGKSPHVRKSQVLKSCKKRLSASDLHRTPKIALAVDWRKNAHNPLRTTETDRKSEFLLWPAVDPSAHRLNISRLIKGILAGGMSREQIAAIKLTAEGVQIVFGAQKMGPGGPANPWDEVLK
jgi:hypothetical protein